MEKETRIDLSEKLMSLLKSQADGVEGLDELIDNCINEIMDRSGVDPKTREKFVAPNENKTFYKSQI